MLLKPAFRASTKKAGDPGPNPGRSTILARNTQLPAPRKICGQNLGLQEALISVQREVTPP